MPGSGRAICHSSAPYPLSDVAAWTFEIGHQVTHRIDNHRYNYWYARRRTFCSSTNNRADSDDDVYFEIDKFGRESRELIDPS
jgi:hypothetical protein